jgi:hypothetical protein
MVVLPMDSPTDIKLIIILIYSVGEVFQNLSVNFEFRTKFFNDPPYFSWSVGEVFQNMSVNFEFRTKFFNDPPYFSWSVGNMTRSEMHLMHNPLKFARSVGNLVGKIDPPTTYRRI